MSVHFSEKEQVVVVGRRKKGVPLLFLALFFAWDMAAGPSAFAGARFILTAGSQYEANAVTRQGSAYLGTDKFVVCYSDASQGQCRVGTVDGTAITWGTEAQFAADVNITESQIGVCQLDTDKFAVVYGDDNAAEDGFVRAATVDGSGNITWGAAVEFSNNFDADSTGCAGIATDKIIIGYNEENSARANVGSGVACYVSTAPRTLTCGTINDYAATPNDYYALYNRPAKLGTDKFVVAFSSVDNTSAEVIAGTTSGTPPAITWGSVVQITNDDTANTFACAPQDGDRFAVVYQNTTGTSGGVVAGTTGTGTDTTITLGSITDFNPSSEAVGSPSCAFIGAERLIITYPDEGVATYNGVVRVCAVNWTTRAVTCGHQNTFEASDVDDNYLVDGAALQVISGYGTNDVKFVVSYINTSGTDDGRMALGRVVRRRVMRIR